MAALAKIFADGETRFQKPRKAKIADVVARKKRSSEAQSKQRDREGQAAFPSPISQFKMGKNHEKSGAIATIHAKMKTKAITSGAQQRVAANEVQSARDAAKRFFKKTFKIGLAAPKTAAQMARISAHAARISITANSLIFC